MRKKKVFRLISRITDFFEKSNSLTSSSAYTLPKQQLYVRVGEKGLFWHPFPFRSKTSKSMRRADCREGTENAYQKHILPVQAKLAKLKTFWP